MPQTLNIAVCEDEAAETVLLCDILNHSDIQNTYTVFTDADSFLASYEYRKYDLLLMDIYMKDSMTGIEAVSIIRETDADIPVAFITTSTEHALESYRLSAIGYIEKPVSAAELSNILHLAMLKKSDAPSLYVKRNKSMERLALSDIMYIEQRARQIFIHLKENEEISCYEKLSELSDQLPAELFFLPHKSYAVNLSYVTRIDTSLKCFVMADDTNIPIKRELSKSNTLQGARIMKKISAIRNIPYLTIILLTLICILLLSSKNMIMSQASYPEATIVSSAYAVVEGSDSDKEEITFPHTFKHLSPRTHVTVTTHINLNKDDPIYIKTVYSPAKVYLDDDLIYEFGRAENYPSYMKDPATEGYLIGTDGHSGDTELRIEYLSPVTRSSLTVYSPIYGAYKSLFFTLLKLNKWSFFIALLELAAGVLFIFISLMLLYHDKEVCKMIFHFGFFSLMAGMWSIGECNYTGVIVKNPTLLYLCAFIGLFSQMIPLLYFCRLAVGFKNDKPIIVIAKLLTVLDLVACVLQLSGTVALSQSMYVFHVILPLILCFLTAYIILEAVRSQNSRAKRLMVPVFILALASCAEIINYHLKFVASLSLLYQIGTLLFIIITGIIMGLNISDMLMIKRENERLIFDMNLLEHSLLEQKKYDSLITTNEQLFKKQRHDLRHQLVAIKGLANTENKQLNEYLDALIHSIPSAPASYCENRVVNSILSYYSAICRNENIALETKLIVPETDDAALDNDLCLVFGNLIENAIEACRRMDTSDSLNEKSSHFIRLHAHVHYKTLIITMDNSFDGHVTIQNGKYRSSKRDDYGIGLSSIRSVAGKYDGDVAFEAADGIFQSSVYLQIYK